jgi:hypothetical protein
VHCVVALCFCGPLDSFLQSITLPQCPPSALIGSQPDVHTRPVPPPRHDLRTCPSNHSRAGSHTCDTLLPLILVLGPLASIVFVWASVYHWKALQKSPNNCTARQQQHPPLSPTPADTHLAINFPPIQRCSWCHAGMYTNYDDILLTCRLGRRPFYSSRLSV